MNELEVCLEQIIVVDGDGVFGPEEGEIVRERREEDAQEEACRWRTN